MNKVHDYGDVTANQLEVLESMGVLQVNWKQDARKGREFRLQRAGIPKKEAVENVAAWSATRNQRSAKPTNLLALNPNSYPHLVDPSDAEQPVEERARSYLHANCAHCHVMAGGGNSQIDLHYLTPLNEANVLGANPLHHRFGIDAPKIVAEGDPARSVLLHRVKIREAGQMPQLATSFQDEAAVELMRTWIEQLERRESKGDGAED